MLHPDHSTNLPVSHTSNSSIQTKNMNTIIELRHMVFHAQHGVQPQERVVGGTYIIDLCLHGDFGKACRSDALADTIDYGTACRMVKEEMSVPSSLLEHVAWRIARRLLCQFEKLTSIDIRLCKQTPPISGAEVREACFLATFDRRDLEDADSFHP